MAGRLRSTDQTRGGGQGSSKTGARRVAELVHGARGRTVAAATRSGKAHAPFLVVLVVIPAHQLSQQCPGAMASSAKRRSKSQTRFTQRGQVAEQRRARLSTICGVDARARAQRAAMASPGATEDWQRVQPRAHAPPNPPSSRRGNDPQPRSRATGAPAAAALS